MMIQCKEKEKGDGWNLYHQLNMRMILCISALLLLFSPGTCHGSDMYRILQAENRAECICIKGILPDNAVFRVKEYERGFYDFSLYLEDGTVFQPVCPVTVEMKSMECHEIYHLRDAVWEKKTCAWDGEKIEFETDHFSIFAVTEGKALMLTPDEIERSVMQKTEISVVYMLDDRIYSAEELYECFQLSFPPTLHSGNMKEQFRKIIEKSTLSVEGSFWVLWQGSLQKKITQAFSSDSGVYYSSMDLEEDSYLGTSEEAEITKMELAFDITQENAKLHSGESIVVLLSHDSDAIHATHVFSALEENLSQDNSVNNPVKQNGQEGLQDLIFHVMDSQDHRAVMGSFSLFDEDGSLLWSSGMNSTHILPCSQVPLVAGKCYSIQETMVQDGYSLPGYPWMLSIGDDFSVSITSLNQQGTGVAETLGMMEFDDYYAIYNEESPHLYLHYQDEENTVEEIELLAGNLDCGYQGCLVREGYTFIGWSESEKNLLLLPEILLDVSAGAENHLYAAWQENLLVCFKLYGYGDYEHAEMIEGSEQMPKAELPARLDLIDSRNMQLYLDCSFLTGDMIVGFAALATNPFQRIQHIRKNEDPEHAMMYWEISENGEAYQPIENGGTLILYVYHRAIEIPVHIFEIGIDGSYMLRDEEWRLSGFEKIDLDYGINVTLPAGQGAINEQVRPDLIVHEIQFGMLDPEVGFIGELQCSSHTISYTWQGICLSGVPTDLRSNVVLAYVYYPAVREVPVHIIEYFPDGNTEERTEWMKTDTLSVSASIILFYSSMDVQMLVERIIFDEYVGKYSFDAAYYGPSYDERSENPIRTLHNTPYGVCVNDDNLFLSQADSLYFVFYENPRSWPVHLVERTVNGYENRDIEWNVQQIQVDETNMNIEELEPREMADDAYCLYAVRRCDALSNLGTSSKYKDLSHITNTKNGLYVRISGQTKYIQLKDPYELFFVYYLKERPMRVSYVTKKEGILIPVHESNLDLSENGKAVSVFLCGNQNYTQPSIGSPQWAEIANDGTPLYHPFVMYATGTEGVQSAENLSMLPDLPWLLNSFSSIKQKDTANSSSKNIGLDKILYVIYDDAQDSAPAYIRLMNQAEQNEMTFILSFDNGSYTNPILIHSSCSGAYIMPDGAEYRISLSPGSENTLYIPNGAGREYQITILDEEGSEIQDVLEDQNLELSVQPASSPLSGTLVKGSTYYWNDATDNIYVSMEDEDAGLTLISVQDKLTRIPAPTGGKEPSLCWMILFLTSICLNMLIFHPMKRR